MNNRSLYILTGIVLLSIALLFGLRLEHIFSVPSSNFAQLNDVNGMAVKYKNQLYTLNLQQQTDALAYLNTAKPVKETTFTKQQRDAVDVDKIIIYSFKQAPNIEITPIAYVDDSLVFSAPLWKKDVYLMEQTHGKLKALLATTHAQAVKHP